MKTGLTEKKGTQHLRGDYVYLLTSAPPPLPISICFGCYEIKKNMSPLLYTYAHKNRKNNNNKTNRI